MKTKLIYSASSHVVLFFKSSFKYFYLLLFLFFNNSLDLHAQLFHNAPGIEWKRSDWYPRDINNIARTQDLSGEDWWYGHTNSTDGIICVGYTSFINYDYDETATDGCANIQNDELNTWFCMENESYNKIKGADFGVLTLISTNGREKIWSHYYNQGDLVHVIQTSDGGYLAIGSTAATRNKNGDPLIYNPGQNGNNSSYFTRTDVISCTDCRENLSHITLVKTNSVGDVEWEYIYGMYPICDLFGNYDQGLAEKAYQNNAFGWDVVETDDNHFRIVGEADADEVYPTPIHSSTHNIHNAVMIQVDNSGSFEWGEFYNSSGIGSDLTEESKVTKIIKYINSFDASTNFIIVGTCYNVDPLSNSKALCMKLPDGASPTPLWAGKYGNLTSTGYNVGCYDVIAMPQLNIDGDDQLILLPLIENCVGCLFSGNNYGEGSIHRIGKLGSEEGTIDISGGNTTPLHAFDLRFGICNTSDGGFAVVSTKQPNAPPATFPNCISSFNGSTYTTDYNDVKDYWNTDAYVAKFNSAFEIEWEITFDEDDDPAEPYPGDQRKQECLYAIVQTPDNGLVISGNYSANFDDAYLVKFYSDCNTREAYIREQTPDPNFIFDYANNNIIDAASLPGYPTLSGSYSVLGSIHVYSGETLSISGASTEIQFFDSRRSGIESNIIVEPGGTLILEDGAKLNSLSACDGSMWDGVQVWGDPNNLQISSYQGTFIMTTEATIENAVVGFIAGVGEHNDNQVYNPNETAGGGIIQIDDGNFINCRRSIHLAPYYKKLPNNSSSSFIKNSDFICNDYMRDPDYSGIDGNRLGINAFITNNHRTGVEISNNYLSNSTSFTQLAKSLRGRGIIVHEAYCDIIGNTIENLDDGIEVRQFSAFTPGRINNNRIDNTAIGIIISGGYRNRLEGNIIFNIPDFGIGILAQNSGAFKIKHNEISSNSSQTFNWGSVIDDSSPLFNMIGPDNIFNQLSFGTQTQKLNDYLQIRCNSYTNHTYAWSVDPSGLGGTLPDQGTGTTGSDEKAANSFFDDPCTGYQHIYSNISFYYYGFSNPPVKLPTCVTTNVNVQDAGAEPNAYCDQFDNLSGSEDELIELWQNETNDQLKSKYFAALYNFYLESDTTGSDTHVLNLLQTWNTQQAWKMLVQAYYYREEYTSARQWMDVIMANSRFPEFTSIFDPLITLGYNGNSIFEMGDSLSGLVAAIADTGVEEKTIAQNIMSYVYGKQYPFFPDTIDGSHARQSFTEKKSVDQSAFISVFPNPFSKQTTLSFNIPENSLNTQVHITDVMGRRIKSIEVNTIGKVDYVFNSNDLDQGLYYISLLLDGKMNAHEKMLVIK